MSGYRVRVLKLASKELEQLGKPIAHRIIQRINWLAQNIEKVRLEPLKGQLSGLYKLRIGDYRVIYEILGDENLIIIHAVGYRRDIYKKR